MAVSEARIVENTYPTKQVKKTISHRKGKSQPIIPLAAVKWVVRCRCKATYVSFWLIDVNPVGVL